MSEKKRPSAERVAAAVEKYLDNLRGGSEAFEKKERARRRAFRGKGRRRRPSEAELKEARKNGKRWV